MLKPTTKPITVTHPQTAELWHPTKNEELTPEQVCSSTKQKVWWKCPKGDDHEWKTYVFAQCKSQGCPVCSGQKVVKSNCLSTLRPEIAILWHPTLNGKLTPNDVVVGSARKIWWKCPKEDDHVWEARGFSLTRNGSGCPVCAGKKAVSSRSLQADFPEVAATWHSELNGKFNPENVVSGSTFKAWWVCEKGHQWKTTVKHRTHGSGCPYCVNQKVAKENSLAITHPNLISTWHQTLNSITPFDVTSGSGQKIWWKCPKGDDHEWEATIANHIDAGCPCCSGRKTVPSNCFLTTHPKIAAEWHPDKNELKNTDVTYASNKIVWFKCPEGHEWKAKIASRTEGKGCPFCASSKGEKAIKEHLESWKIEYISQYKFVDCRNVRPLPFDFVLFKDNKPLAAIEFQGRQHYLVVEYFGGESGHKQVKMRDKIKKEYCSQNNIPLLEIKYDQVNLIEHALKEFCKINNFI